MVIQRNVQFKNRLIQFTNSYVTKFRFCHQGNIVAYEKPKYPPILDPSPEGRRRHARQLWYDSIKAMPTVDQKLHEIVIKRKKSYKVYPVRSFPPRCVAVPFQPYITRTCIINSLPDALCSTVVDKFLDVKNDFCEILVKRLSKSPGMTENAKLEDFLSRTECGVELVNDFLSLCKRKIALKRFEFLSNSDTYLKPPVMSYWWHEDYKATHKLFFKRNFCFQFKDYPGCIVATEKPIEPILPLDDPLCSGGIDSYDYRPEVLGIAHIRNHYISSLLGFGSNQCSYPLLQVYAPNELKQQSILDKNELKEMENGFGVMSSFGWLNAIATNEGFTPFQDLTYPIVGRTIISDGQDWSFFVYQLNTINFHSDTDMKDRRNICWASEKMRLFDTIEDGQVKGINDEVFKTFLKFIYISPEMNSDIKLKPYLGKDLRTEKEILLMSADLKKMYSNIPPLSEYKKDIPLWQKIYKFHPDAPPSPYLKME